MARAVRNVPWSSELWRRYALACEARAWSLAVEAGPSESSNGGSGTPDQHASDTPLDREFRKVEGMSCIAIHIERG